MDLLKWKISTMSPTGLNLFRYIIIYIYIYILVSSGTWTHTVLHYYFLRIACLPISTCLHNYIQKINYPKKPIRVTPIFLPIYYYPFNPYHHSQFITINILYSPTKLPYYYNTTQHNTTPNIYIHITPLTNIFLVRYIFIDLPSYTSNIFL